MDGKFVVLQEDLPIVRTLKTFANYLLGLPRVQALLVIAAIVIAFALFFFVPIAVVCKNTFSRGKKVYAKPKKADDVHTEESQRPKQGATGKKAKKAE